jgi:hypothetical protein
MFLLEPKKSLILITFLLYTRVMHLSIKQRKITDCFYLSNLFQENVFTLVRSGDTFLDAIRVNQ